MIFEVHERCDDPQFKGAKHVAPRLLNTDYITRIEAKKTPDSNTRIYTSEKYLDVLDEYDYLKSVFIEKTY